MHDLPHAEHAQDAGDLAVADAHRFLELPGGKDFDQADRNAGPAEALRRLLVNGGTIRQFGFHEVHGRIPQIRFTAETRETIFPPVMPPGRGRP